MPDQPSQQEMSWPDLARALIWLATADGVPAMQQIEAARLVFDAWTIRVNTNVGGMPECPLLAICRHRAPTSGTSALPPKADIGRWPQRRPESRRKALPHSRLDGLDCHLCLAQQRQPDRARSGAASFKLSVGGGCNPICNPTTDDYGGLDGMGRDTGSTETITNQQHAGANGTSSDG
jgi:hypothetical protein